MIYYYWLGMRGGCQCHGLVTSWNYTHTKETALVLGGGQLGVQGSPGRHGQHSGRVHAQHSASIVPHKTGHLINLHTSIISPHPQYLFSKQRPNSIPPSICCRVYKVCLLLMQAQMMSFEPRTCEEALPENDNQILTMEF